MGIISNLRSHLRHALRWSNTFETNTAPSANVVTYFQAGLVCPTPDPATFSTAPAQNGVGGATMTASLATGLGTIQYKFRCQNRPQFDSDWQTSRTYAPTGLPSGDTLSFCCLSRNQSHAETRHSDWASVVIL